MMNNEKMKKFGFTRKILDDFQGLPLLFVTFFVKILDDFHDCVSECVSLQRKINNPFWVGHGFFPGTVAIFIGHETKHTYYQRKSTKKKELRSAPLSIILLLQ